MNIRLGKLWFTFEYGDNDIIGQCELAITKYQFKYLEIWGLTCNYCWEIDNDKNDEDEEDAYYYHTYSADDIIKYFEYCLQKTKKTEIIITYSHPFWLVHDYLHAKYKDITNYACNMIDEYTERSRLLETVKLCKKKNIKLDRELLESIELAHYQRYKIGLDLSKYYINE